ncbi:MAG TPA: CpsD/CapB family tyrosine-protein kinase [Candidatus Krumholzibacteria bacterium]
MSKMFDALRRAEAERRKKQVEGSGHDAPALESVAPRPREAAPPPPLAPVASPRPERVLPAVVQPAPAFEGDMLRELGILHNSLESRLEKKTGRVLLFTSAMHGEGVTTLAIAFARLLAMQGDQRVILIELNARTPSFATRFTLTAAEGATHYFSSHRNFSSLVQRPAGESFDIVHVGTPDATLIQINLEREFPHMMEEARRNYDTVIIDAPPVVICPETPPLAPHVDGVVLVVHAGRTKRETVDRSIKQLLQFQGRVLGVVLNRKRYYIPRFIYRRL